MKQLTFDEVPTTLVRLALPTHSFRSLLGHGTVLPTSFFKMKNEIVNGNKEFSQKKLRG